MIILIIICAVLVGMTGSFLPLLMMLAIGIPLGIISALLDNSDNKKRKK